MGKVREYCNEIRMQSFLCRTFGITSASRNNVAVDYCTDTKLWVGFAFGAY